MPRDCPHYGPTLYPTQNLHGIYVPRWWEVPVIGSKCFMRNGVGETEIDGYRPHSECPIRTKYTHANGRVFYVAYSRSCRVFLGEVIGSYPIFQKHNFKPRPGIEKLLSLLTLLSRI